MNITVFAFGVFSTDINLFVVRTGALLFHELGWKFVHEFAGLPEPHNVGLFSKPNYEQIQGDEIF